MTLGTGFVDRRFVAVTGRPPASVFGKAYFAHIKAMASERDVTVCAARCEGKALAQRSKRTTNSHIFVEQTERK